MKKKSFTLIELLVVIAIVAILTAMLLPALSKAKAAAYTASCQGNMRQQSLGILAYTGNYANYLPMVFTANNDPQHQGYPFGGNYSWHELIANYLGYTNEEIASPWMVHHPCSQYAGQGGKENRKFSLLACPGAKGDITEYGHTDTYGRYNYTGRTTYFSHKDWTGVYNYKPIHRADPGIVVILDGVTGTHSYCPKRFVDQAYGCYPRLRHLNAANYLFGDSHVEKNREYYYYPVGAVPAKGSIWKASNDNYTY